MIFSDAVQALVQLLATEYHCTEDSFFRSENVLTELSVCDGVGRYEAEKPFFRMVTLGNNAVISADAVLRPFLRDYIQNKTGHWLFEFPNLLQIEQALKPYSCTLGQSRHMFLPAVSVIPQTSFPTKWFFDREIFEFYGDKRFPNAICEQFLPQRPDRMVAVAYDGDEIMGMAGCSEDAPGWMQIGIDVMPQYRSMGVGTYLVTVLKNKIEEMGDIPFYGTSLSNYHSWNIALKSGFKPAWVEIGAYKRL